MNVATGGSLAIDTGTITRSGSGSYHLVFTATDYVVSDPSDQEATAFLLPATSLSPDTLAR